jgi:hypothetical protein
MPVSSAMCFRLLWGLVMTIPKAYGFEWSGDYFGPGLADHLHALGVIALNYNRLEETFYALFCEYFGTTPSTAILFSQFKNNFRLEAFKVVVCEYEKDPAVVEALGYFASCYNVCADNRNILMHSAFDAVQPGDTTLKLLKSARNDPRKHTNLPFDIPTLRRTADEIWSVDHYGVDLLFYSLTRSGLMKSDDSHALTTLPEKPARPSNLSLLLQPNGQNKPARQGSSPE